MIENIFIFFQYIINLSVNKMIPIKVSTLHIDTVNNIKLDW